MFLLSLNFTVSASQIPMDVILQFLRKTAGVQYIRELNIGKERETWGEGRYLY